MDGFHVKSLKFKLQTPRKKLSVLLAIPCGVRDRIPFLNPMLSIDIVQFSQTVTADRPTIKKVSIMARAGVSYFTVPVVLFLLPGEASAQKKPERAEGNGIAAQVNGQVITKNQVAFLLAPKQAKLEKRFPDRGPEFERLLEDARKYALKQLTDRRILIDRFNQPEVQIAPEAIQNEIAREIRENYQSDANKLRDALRACRMTVDGYRSLLRDGLIAEEIQLRRNRDK